MPPTARSSLEFHPRALRDANLGNNRARTPGLTRAGPIGRWRRMAATSTAPERAGRRHLAGGGLPLVGQHQGAVFPGPARPGWRAQKLAAAQVHRGRRRGLVPSRVELGEIGVPSSSGSQRLGASSLAISRQGGLPPARPRLCAKADA